MRILPSVIAALSLACLALNPARAQPVLTRATLHTHTDGDNKDHDTCIHGTVKTADGQTLLAHIDGADCGGTDSTEFNNGSDHDTPFFVDAAGVDKSSCRGFVAHIFQKTHGGRGHDTWKFDARMVLEFSDHTNLVADASSLTLSSRSEDDAPSVDLVNGK